MVITTVLLDAGGVILDECEQEKVRAEIIAEMLAEFVPGYSLDAYWADIKSAVQCFAPRVYQYVLWKYSRNDRAWFEALYARFLTLWEQRKPALVLMKGIEREVRAISQRFDVGIAGQYGRDILTLLEQRGMLGCFRYRFTQDEFAITKPDPRYLEQIAKACGVDPRQCIMVGDRIDKDVIPAKQVGMKTIRIRTGLHRNQEPRIPWEIPDAELPGVSGLAEAVERVAAG